MPPSPHSTCVARARIPIIRGRALGPWVTPPNSNATPLTPSSDAHSFELRTIVEGRFYPALLGRFGALP